MVLLAAAMGEPFNRSRFSEWASIQKLEKTNDGTQMMEISLMCSQSTDHFFEGILIFFEGGTHGTVST